MQRLACLLLTTAAACTSGTGTGEATLSNTNTPVKSAAAKPFKGADGAGNMVLGWKIELYKNDPGSDCTSATKLAILAVYSNMAATSGDQALLSTGGITLVAMAPPMVQGSATANLSLTDGGISITGGQVTLTEFHLTADAKHADTMSGTIAAGGTDGTGNGVTLDGMFTAPVCN
jgi:hypothetical protein